ncbi:eCIS core domain-containing protein [Streptomyces hundungensis]|uniref:eCIS core domain-containing protein n=1 Tax=Streptomyces hundungensis TaxID=1077946 RepID=UPI003400F36A
MPANEHAAQVSARDGVDRARGTPRRSGVPAGLLALQATAGNAAVVQMLRAAGHGWVQPERHQHGAGCGHQGAEQAAEQPAVQRSTVHNVLRAPGRPMDDTTRSDMEARLGADFSDVRIHNDAAAKASAAEVGARAYTSGNHVVIGDGGRDKHTLAHELTHVIQQRQGPVAGTDNGSGLRVSDPSDRFERAAEANAKRAMSQGTPAPAPSATTDSVGAPGDATAVQRASTTSVEDAVVTSYQPAKAGSLALWDLPIERPERVTGPIQPTGTGGRPAAPEPLSVTSLQSAYKDALKQHYQAAGTRVPRGATPSNSEVWRDLFGGAGYDRGHIMGLEVGGSDVTENIVPQWSLNQQSGEWRDIEKALVALGSGNVTFTPHYPSAHGNFRAVMIPTRVDVAVQSATGPTTATWQNDPNLNDLFRSGQDPDSPAESYEYAKQAMHGTGTATVNDSQMHLIALMAHTHNTAIADTHNDYVAQINSGQIPGPSAFDSLMQQANMSAFTKAARLKLIDVYIRCGWVTKSGADYIVDDPTFADVSSSSSSGTESESDSDASMGSAGSVVASVPFSQMQLGNDSGSDSDYMSE